MARRLLTRIEPHRDESPAGYYRRLAQANRLASWTDLARFIGGSAAASHLYSNPESTAAALGLDPQWTEDLSSRDAMQRAWQRFRRRGHDAVCPTCLVKAPYLRQSWEHAFTTACAVHGCRLVDTCDRCGEQLSNRRPAIERCMCGRDLRKMATTDASASERWLSGLLAGTPEKHQLLLPKMTVTSVAALSQRIQTLCELSDPRLPAPRRNSAVPLNLEQAREFLRPLDSLLTAWPIDFKTHVARRLEAASPSARTLNGALGLWYTRLKRYSIDEQEEPFLRETLRAVNEHAPGLLGLDGADKSYGEIQQVCSVRDAAARLGVGRDTLAQAVERGQVKARTRRYGTRRLMYQIPIPELERLEVSRAAWVDEARAMALLDVPAAVIANLKASGELTFDLRWREDITKSGPISLDSVTRLLMTIREQVDEAAASDDFIVLRDLTSRRVGDKKAIADLYVAITSGALRGVGRLPTRGIGSVRYNRQDVARYFGTPVLEAGLTIERLSELTGWKYESIKHWLDLGLMNSDEITLRGQRCRVISPTHVVSFLRQYITLSELARTLQTSPGAVSRRFKALDIVGAKPLPNGQRRGGLIRLGDLARLASGEAERQVPEPAVGDLDRLPNRAKPEGTQI